MTGHKLLGSPVSYYTGKARAYLRYKQIPFEEILSSGKVFEEVILPRVGYAIIPVVVTEDDKILQDTTDIIDYFEGLYPEPSIYPETPLQRLVALLMEVYGDEWLVIPAMHYRWNIPENKENAIRKFGETSAPDASPDEQLKIGMDRSTRFAGAVPRLGITENNKAAVEASYMQFLTDFQEHLKHHPFLLGSRPSIGDYGLIGPLYAHLYLDPASGRIMKSYAPLVAEWVERVHNPSEHDGVFLPDDKIPETLLPLLARMFREHVPVLQSTVKHVRQWAEQNPGDKKIPRAIGMHSFTVEGCEDQRAVFPANQWMWQRPVNFYQKQGTEVKAEIAKMLSSLPGAVEALEEPISIRITRENYRFRLA